MQKYSESGYRTYELETKKRSQAYLKIAGMLLFSLFVFFWWWFQPLLSSYFKGTQNDQEEVDVHGNQIQDSEGLVSYFGQALLNGTERDSDNDGTPDISDTDDDNDGTPDGVDADDNNDGVPDSLDSQTQALLVLTRLAQTQNTSLDLHELPIPYNGIQWQEIDRAPKPSAYASGDIKAKADGTLRIRRNTITTREIVRHSIEASDIGTSSVTSRTIRNGTIVGDDISSSANLTINSLTVGGSSGAGSITTDSIVADSITTDTLTTDTLTAETITTDTLTAETISVTSLTASEAVTAQYFTATDATETSTFGQVVTTFIPTLPHLFGTWAIDAPDANSLSASLVVNPASSVADGNLISASVAGNVKFLVDAEGDVFVNSLTSAGSVTVGATNVATLTVEGQSNLGDSPTDLTIVSGSLGIRDTTPLYAFTVGNGDLFGVNDAGAIVAATGITSSGTITFSGLSDGVVTSSSGVLSSGTIGASYITADSLDFSEFQDQLDLDASTDILVTGSQLFSITNTGTGNSFQVNDVAGDTTPFIIDASGNVGIGTTSPSQKLTVVGNGSFTGNVISSASSLATFGISNTASSGVYGGFNGSSITGAYFQLFGSTATGSGTTSGGGGEFVINSSNGSTNFNLLNFNGSTYSNILSALSSGNVGIGDASPAALFTVGAGDLFQVNSSGSIAAATGITSSGTITFSGLSDGVVTSSSGVLSSGTIGASSITADSLDFAQFVDAMTVDATTTFNLDTNNADLNFDSNTLVIDSSANSIGIGTASPGAVLDVVGAGRIANFSGLTYTSAGGDATGRSALNIVNRAAGGYGGGVHVYSSGKNSGTFLSSTNTSQGVWSAGAPLGSGVNNNFYFTETSASAIQQSSGIISFLYGTGLTVGTQSSLNESMRIDALGNVGIGTTSPGTYGNVELRQAIATGIGTPPFNLAVVDTTTQSAGHGGGIIFAGAYTGTTLTTAGAIRASKTNSTAGDYSFGLSFYTRNSGSSPAENMVISNQGNVGIGTSTPSTKLAVVGDAYITSGIGIGRLPAGQGLLSIDRAAGNPAIQLYQAGTQIGQVRADSSLSNVGFADSTGAFQLSVNTSSGNIGIGDTTPAALFTVGSGDLFQVNSSGAIASATGITSSGTITFSGLTAGGVVQAASGTGVLSVGTLGSSSITADSLDFAQFVDAMTVDATTTFNLDTNNADLNFDSNTLFVDSSANMVGIGTASPLVKLVVSDGTYGIETSPGSTSYLSAISRPGGSYSDLTIRARDISFLANNAQSLFLQNSTGNVGIGTTSPNTKLSFGTGSNQEKIRLYDSGVTASSYGLGISSGEMQIYAASGGNISLRSGGFGGTTNIFVNGTSSNVGIGTTSPGYKLDIQGTLNGTTFSSLYANTLLQLRNNSAIANSLTGMLFSSINDSSQEVSVAGIGARITDRTAGSVDGDLIFGTTLASVFSEKMVILNSGNVGIGTTTPSQLLEVASAGSGDTSLIVVSNGTGGNERLHLGYNSSAVTDNVMYAQMLVDGTGNLLLSSRTNNASGLIFYTNAGTDGVERMRIASSGDVGIGTVGPDRKLDILDASNPQLRLTYTDGSVYTDLQTTSAGYLYVNPIGGNVLIGPAAGDVSNGLTISSNNFATLTLSSDENANSSSGDAAIRFQNNATFVGELGVDASDLNKIKIFQGGTAGNFSGSGITLDTIGNVGIGTASPDAKLVINGSGQSTAALDVDSGNLGASLVLSDDRVAGAAGSGGSLIFGGTGSGGDLGRFAAIKGLLTNSALNSVGDLAFSTRNATSDSTLTERLRITSGGNVGIGTASPSQNLTIFAADPVLYLDSNGGSAAQIRFDAGKIFSLNDGSGNRLTILNNNVGIGDNDPAALFTVGSGDLFQVNSSGAIASATGITSSGTITFSGLTAGGVVQAASGTGVLSVGTLGSSSITADSLDFAQFVDAMTVDATTTFNLDTNNADLNFDSNTLFIDSSTNMVGIGTASPSAALHVSRDAGDASLTVEAKSTAGGTGFIKLITSRTGGARQWWIGPNITTTDGSFQLYDQTAGFSRIIVNTSGNVGIGDTTPAALFTVGSGDLFQVNSSGAIASATGVTSSGTITFSGLGSGAVSASSGVLSAGTLGVSSGGTGSTSFTNGSVVFSNGSILTQDNANFFWDDTNNRLGIGTTSPSGKLDVQAASGVGMYVNEFSAGNPAFNVYSNGTGYLYFRPKGEYTVFMASGSTNATMQIQNGGTGYSQVRLYGSSDNRIVTGTGNLTIAPASDTIFSSGNVGIGDTSPASLFTVGSGDLFQVNSSGAIVAAAGITNTGAVTSTGGAVNLNVSSNNAVNIGTGTTTSTVSIGGGSNAFALDSSTIDISSGAITGATGITSSGTITFSGLSTAGVVTNTSGGVLGTTIGADGECLTVTGGALTWGACGGGGISIGDAITTGTAGSILFVDGSGNLGQDNSNFFWDNTNDRLGLGTTTPTAQLSVFGINNALQLAYDGSNYSQFSTSSSGILTVATSNTAQSQLIIGDNTAVDSSIVFDEATNDYYVGNDTTTGNFMIGTGATVGSTALLTLDSTGNLSMATTATGVGASNLCWDGSGDSAWGACTSLRKYKDNVTDLSLGLNTLMQLRPVEFDWNSNISATGHDLGFIAEEVASVSPLLAEYGGVNGALSGVKYNLLTSLIVKSVQEQQLQVKANQDQISELDSESQEYFNDFLNLESSVTTQAQASTQSMSSLEASLINVETNQTTLANELVALSSQIQVINENLDALNEFYTTFSLDRYVQTDEQGNLDLLEGSLRVKTLETGGLAVEVIDQDSATLGKGVIPAGQTRVTIETTAVSVDSRIFVTPEVGETLEFSAYGTTDITPGESFSVVIPTILTQDFAFSWWIVEEK